MRYPLALLALAALAALSACTTFSVPEPTALSESLVVGRVVLDASGTQQYETASVNGTHSYGIVVTVLDTGHGLSQDVVVRSAGGLFALSNFAPGRYEITELDYKFRASNGSWSEVWLHPKDPMYFDVGSGTVTNLGTITWTYNGTKQQDYVEYNRGYAGVRSEFGKLSPNSAWLERPWSSGKFTDVITG